MHSHQRVDEDQATDWQQDARGHFQRLDEFIEFFLEDWDFLQQKSQFENSEGKQIATDFMALDVDTNERGNDGEDVQRFLAFALDFQTENLEEEEQEEPGLADLLGDGKSHLGSLALSGPVANHCCQQQGIHADLDLPRPVANEQIFDGLCGTFLFSRNILRVRMMAWGWMMWAGWRLIEDSWYFLDR